MKKLLALVLALVMSMSLVTISNAAFKDADKIDYDEAVTVMNAVGVLVGDENGSFATAITGRSLIFGRLGEVNFGSRLSANSSSLSSFKFLSASSPSRDNFSFISEISSAVTSPR